MLTQRGGHGGPNRRLWIALLVMLIGLPLGFATARQAVFDQNSPATGRAQVVTQGIAELPGEEVVWRVVERVARPRDEAVPGTRVLGFVLATEDPVLLTNITAEGDEEDVARLGPGESFLVKEGTQQIRASMTGQEVTYLAFELVPVAVADDVGSGTLIFKTNPFLPPPGKHDVDLVRNLLLTGDLATVPDTGNSVAILATEGAVDVLPAGGGRSRTLQAGESAIFEPGELEITPAQATGTVSGVRAQIASLTNTLQDGGTAPAAAYVVAVIGPEIPPVDTTPVNTPVAPQPTPTPEDAAPVVTETPEPLPTEEPEPTTVPTLEPTEPPVVLGTIDLYVYNCPPGMTVENMAGEVCEFAGDGFEISLDGPDRARTLADAVSNDGQWRWGDLPLGTYTLRETVLPEGFIDYFVPGSAAVGGSPNSGYTITLDESAPEIAITLFNFQPALIGEISVRVLACPPDTTWTQFDPATCQGGPRIARPRLSAPGGTQLTGVPANGAVTWSGLDYGSYSLGVNVVLKGYAYMLAPDGLAYSTTQTIPVAVDADTPEQDITLYLFNSQPIL